MNVMNKEESKVSFITGVSRAFGRELASAALEQGDLVIGTIPAGRVRRTT